MPALTPDNDIFISYSRLDTSRIKPAISILKASGADVFLDTEDIEYGQEWSKALDDNIREAERIFVFWSKNSAKSVEVRKEYQKAIALGSVMVIPVMLDKTPLPEDLAKYQGINEFGLLLQQATQVNNPLTVIYRYGLPTLALALAIFASIIFVSSRPARKELDEISTNNVSNTSGEIFPTDNTGNVETNVNIGKSIDTESNSTGNTIRDFPQMPPSLPPEPGNTRHQIPFQKPDTNANAANRDAGSKGNGEVSAPDSGTPIQARAEKPVEQPAADALPLTYPLILLFSIILLTALPAIYIWNRRRNRLIKALRAELFPQEK